MQEIKQLIAITQSLKEKYKHHNKNFTLDGKLVGDIGEVLVAEHYKDIKNIPQYFIAVQLKEDGTFDEVYNGTGSLIHERMLSHLSNERKHNYRLSVIKLKELNNNAENKKIKRING